MNELDKKIRYDVVDSILYAFYGSGSIDYILDLTDKIDTTISELMYVFQHLKETGGDAGKSKEGKRLKFLTAIRDKVAKRGGKIDLEKCKNCKGVGLLFGFVNFYNPPKEKNESMRLCAKCKSDIQSNPKFNFCELHGSYFPSSLIVKCGLFNKCSPKYICGRSKCLNHHYMEIHYGKYENKSWRKSKKFIEPKNMGSIITSPIPVGIEIEAVGSSMEVKRENTAKICRQLGIGSDLSLRNYHKPVEVQSPPATTKPLEKLTEQIIEALTKDGFIVNRECGFHFHLDVEKIFGKLNSHGKFYKSLFYTYYSLESTFYKLLPIGRRTNRFSFMLGNWFFDADDYVSSSQFEKTHKKKLSKIWYNVSNMDQVKMAILTNNPNQIRKYAWVNFHSLINGTGLEIRSLEGTFDTNLIFNWINLHQKFITGVRRRAGDNYVFVKNHIIRNKSYNINSGLKMITRLCELGCETKEERDLVSSFIIDRYNKCKESENATSGLTRGFITSSDNLPNFFSPSPPREATEAEEVEMAYSGGLASTRMPRFMADDSIPNRTRDVSSDSMAVEQIETRDREGIERVVRGM